MKRNKEEVIIVRRIVCLLLSAVLFTSMIFSASAISYSDRGRYYLYVTSSSTAMFSQSTQTDENGTTTSILNNIGTLPAGTPISAGETVDDIYQKVIYMDQSAATHTVIISKDVIKGNYVTLDFGGSIGKVRIPRPAAANASFIKDYMNYRGISVSDNDIANALGVFTSSATDAPLPEGQVAEQNDTFPTAAGTAEASATPAPDASGSGKSSSSKKSTAKATEAPSRKAVEADTLVYLNEQGKMLEVALTELGIARSTVVLNGQELKVATSSLVWETNAEDNERLAVVYAPKSGKASFRKTSKSSSMILKKVPGGTIVRVFDIQSKMTGVYVDGQAGYILNSALKFMEPASTFTTGRLSYKGSFTNTHRINLYTLAKESSKRIGGYHAGDVVTILGEQGTWTELDINGYHGYILSKYVTPDEVTEPLSVPDVVVDISDTLIEEDVTDEETSDADADNGEEEAYDEEAYNEEEEDDGF